MASAGVLRNGARRDYVIAGIGIGLAAATKYTGRDHGGVPDRRGGLRRCRRSAAQGRCAGSLSPWAARCWPSSPPTRTRCWTSRPSTPASRPSRRWPAALIRRSSAPPPPAAPPSTSGRSPGGWAGRRRSRRWPAACCWCVRRRLALALVLLPAPIVFIVFMGDQQRFFGRWLMPMFPIVALLAAYGAVELARWLIRTRRVPVVAGRRRGHGRDAGPEPGHRGPQRRGALARRHAQPDPGVDGPPRAGRRQGGGRAGRLRRLGARTSGARCRGRRAARAGSCGTRT